MSRDIFHKTRLINAPSNLSINTNRDEATKTSLGNPFHCLIACRVENFFWMSTLNLFPSSLKPLPLVLSLHVSVNSLHVSWGFPPDTGRLQLGRPKAFTFPDWTIPILLEFFHRRGVPSLTTLVVCSGLAVTIYVLPVPCLLQSWMQHSRRDLTRAE